MNKSMVSINRDSSPLADYPAYSWQIWILSRVGWRNVGYIADRAGAMMHVQALRRLLPLNQFAVKAVRCEGVKL